jgi:hypothetical protein
MFMMTIVGSIIYGVGSYLIDRHGSSYRGMERFAVQAGFAFSCRTISLAGGFATWRLQKGRSGISSAYVAQLEPDETDPSDHRPLI